MVYFDIYKEKMNFFIYYSISMPYELRINEFEINL